VRRRVVGLLKAGFAGFLVSGPNEDEQEPGREGPGFRFRVWRAERQARSPDSEPEASPDGPRLSVTSGQNEQRQ